MRLAALQIDDEVSLKAPFTQGESVIPAGTSGKVKAVYPAGLIDIEFDDYNHPDFEEEIISENTFAIPTELVENQTAIEDGDEQERKTVNVDEKNPIVSPHNSRTIGEEPYTSTEMDERADERMKESKHSVRILLSEYVQTGGQDREDFVRYASIRSGLSEIEIEETINQLD